MKHISEYVPVNSIISLEEAALICWDVIVIGTGMGGATTGYSLATNGQSVLFIEKGPLGGEYIQNPKHPYSQESYFLSGSQGAVAEILPVKREGVGGSTVLYAAQLERLKPCDFNPAKNFKNIKSSLPDNWPIDYYSFASYYAQAEALYGVRGTQESGNDHSPSGVSGGVPELTPYNKYFKSKLDECGFETYRSHIACDYVEGCTGCQGEICDKTCKNDALKIALSPALRIFNAKIILNCIVVKINAGESVSSVECKKDGHNYLLQAKNYVLAAGALASPIILLNSKSKEWPNGIGNNSGLVGKNLMWHACDWFCIKPKKEIVVGRYERQLSSNEFYWLDNLKMGTFQEVGVNIFTQERIKNFLDPKYKRIPKIIRKYFFDFIYAYLLSRVEIFFKSANLYVSIIEDLPQLENKVFIDVESGLPAIHYSYDDDLKRRCSYFRDQLKKKLRKNFHIFNFTRLITGSAANNLNFGHALGTCRFGLDPSSSVLNECNRVHGVNNLFVTDASFFPSSGGVNPSLTIAANSLRVAKLINADK